jgi:hypothetical protein
MPFGTRPLTNKQRHGQANYTLRDREEPSKYPETKRLYGFSGRRNLFLPSGHHGITSQMLQQPFRDSRVPGSRVYSTTTRRILMFHQPKVDSSLPLAWTSSPRIWNEIINVVNCALKRAGIRTLLYVDDLFTCYGNLYSPRNHRQDVRRCRDHKISDERPVDVFSSPTRSPRYHHRLQGKRQPATARKTL